MAASVPVCWTWEKTLEQLAADELRGGPASDGGLMEPRGHGGHDDAGLLRVETFWRDTRGRPSGAVKTAHVDVRICKRCGLLYTKPEDTHA